MDVLIRHAEFRPNATKTQIEIRLGEREWMIGRDGPAIFDPLIHAPKMCVAQFYVERVHDAGHQRQLLRRADGSANTDGIIRRRLLPNAYVFERLGAIKLFERVV